MLGREGHPVQCKQGAGKRQGGAGPGENGELLKSSRLEQAHEIRPNCLYYNYDYWLLLITGHLWSLDTVL